MSFFGGVGDQNFRAKSNKVFKSAFLDGRTIVFVSHNLPTIKQYCNKVAILKEGEMICFDETSKALNVYSEKYSN